MGKGFSKRGLVWIAVGVVLLVAGFFLERPLVLRGTKLPFWPFVTGLGVILLIVDVVRARRGGDSATPAP